MKKTLIVLLLLMIIIPIFAENSGPQKGNFVVSLPIVSYESKGQKLYEDVSNNGQITISILAGNYELGIQYFIIDGLAVGGSFGMSAWEQSDLAIQTITIKPLLTYYLRLNSILPYIGAGYRYMTSKEDNTGATDKYSGFIVKGGAAMMLKNTLAFYADASYVQQDFTPDGGSATSGNIITIALGIKGFF